MSDTDPAPRRPYRRLSPDARREELIVVALQLFSTTPPEQLSLEDVAAAAGVSRALLYRYFSSLNELYLEALRTATDGLVERLVPPPDGPLLEQLDQAVLHFFEFAEAYAASYVAMLRSGSVLATSQTDALVDQVRVHAVNELLARLAITDPPPYLMLTLRCWVATVEGTVLIWLQEKAFPAEDLRGWLVDQLVVMLLASAGHDRTLARQLREVLARQGSSPETDPLLRSTADRLLRALSSVVSPRTTARLLRTKRG
jgi:AcrR family transcriptional regulator